MNEKDFYVDLLSNSSFNYFPDNTLSNFKTKLNKLIEFDGEWDVALSEIYFPLPIQNIRDIIKISITYRVAVGDKYKDYILETSLGSSIICLEPGYYKSIHDILNKLNLGFKTLWENRKKEVSIEGSKCISFELNSNGLVEMKLYKFKVENSVVLFLPIFKSSEQKFAEILGFDGVLTKNKAEETLDYTRIIGKREPDIRAGQNFLMIYCDIIKPRLVGDSLSQLLRTIPIPFGTTEDYADKTFNSPQYHSVEKRRIETINIYLASETGKQIHFGSGRVHLSLHFRKRK